MTKQIGDIKISEEAINKPKTALIVTVASPTIFDINDLNKKIEELLVCEDKISKLKEIVPEFDHRLN